MHDRTEITDALDGSFYLVPDVNKAVSKEGELPQAHPSLLPGYRPGGVPDSYAHNWSPSSMKDGFYARGKHLADQWGRVCIPRGVNLSGSSKIPINHDSAKFPLGHENVTFVGRPFPLEDAPQHFARLRRWGLTLVRVLITWEALEHAGPGQYDHEYLEYLAQLLTLMENYGICAIISMHQDVWSRYSGGSGAPAWTLEAVGFDLTKLEETGAAYLGGVKAPGKDEVRGRWPTGYQKLASSTMWTCFWAGDVFAPKLRVKHKDERLVGIQTFLQETFLDCFDRLARAVGDISTVIGFEVLNEPHRGYISVPSLHYFDYYTDLHLHETPSALQSFALASGHPTSIPHYKRSFPFPTSLSHYVTKNVDGVKLWKEDGPTGGECIWEMHGVWGWDTKKQAPLALRENYFKNDPRTGKQVDWYVDYWYPFVSQWASRIHANAGPNKLVLIEGIPNEFCPPSWSAEHRPKNMVFAPHWYDLNTLFTKTFGNVSYNVQGLSRGMFLLKALYWGKAGVRSNYHLQIRTLVEAAKKSLGDVPVLIGECGVPMDVNKGEAFRTGDFTWQEQMMDALLHALERTMVGFTLWNYNPVNTDDEGDYWNGENFSWFSQSRSQLSGALSVEDMKQVHSGLDEGGRLLSAVVRPYPGKVAGVPLSFLYESETGSFEFRYITTGDSSDEGVLRCLESEIYVPSILTIGRRMIVEGIGSELYTYDESRQTLFVVHRPHVGKRAHTIRVKFDPPLQVRGYKHTASLYAVLFIISLLLSIAAFYILQ